MNYVVIILHHSFFSFFLLFFHFLEGETYPLHLSTLYLTQVYLFHMDKPKCPLWNILWAFKYYQGNGMKLLFYVVKSGPNDLTTYTTSQTNDRREIMRSWLSGLLHSVILFFSMTRCFIF